MSGLFRKFAPANIGLSNPSSGSPFRSKKNDKDGDGEADVTPLQGMLRHAGPVRADGSDKFYGMENALYYSVPFRDGMTHYPPTYKPENRTQRAVPPTFRTSVASAGEQKKVAVGSEALKNRTAFNAGQPLSVVPTAPEKPDSAESKKRRAISTGPMLELTAEKSNTYGMELDPFTALKDVFEALVASPSRIGVVSPQHFLDVFKKNNDLFRAAMHQDAHEFYGLVLNHVITAIAEYEKQEKRLQSNDFQTMTKPGLSDRMTIPSPGTPGTSWLHKIFEGVMTSETRCLTCETASQRDETFLDLSIDLENNSSVTACLRKFSAEEMLRDTEKFHCDHCGSLQEAEKRMKIKKLPQILTLCLKRFKYTDDLQRLQKVFDTVVYPYHLRMFNTTADAEDPDRLYELYAVVVHIGANAYHGHYISVIKTKDRGWLLFDDEMVEPVDKHYVRNFFGDRPGQACAYLLFYQATTIEAVRKEQEAEGKDLSTAASQDTEELVAAEGPHPSSISKAVDQPGTPLEEKEEFTTTPLAHAPTVPLVPPPPPASEKPAPRRIPTSPPRINGESFTKAFSRDPREREKKEAKEAEKILKMQEKERLKEQERQRKDAETARKAQDRIQASEGKGMETNEITEDPNQPERVKESPPRSLFGSLSRNTRGSKSTSSRKSFNFISGGRNGPNPTYHGTATTSNGLAKASGEFAMLPGEASSSTTSTNGTNPQQHVLTAGMPIERAKMKERFSLANLGRKKSRDLLSGS